MPKPKQVVILLTGLLILIFSDLVIGQQLYEINLTVRGKTEFSPLAARGYWDLNGKSFRITLLDKNFDNKFTLLDHINIMDTSNNIEVSFKMHENVSIYDSALFKIHKIDSLGRILTFQKLKYEPSAHKISYLPPDFDSLQSYKGAIDSLRISIAESRYKYYYVNIWSPYCAPCLKKIPFLKEFDQFETKVINVCGDCVLSDVKDAINNNNFPGYHFYSNLKTAKLALRKDIWFPSSILLDSLGSIIYYSGLGQREPHFTLNNIFLNSIKKGNDSISVLFIGNSYLKNGAIPNYFLGFCKSYQINISLHQCAINGATLYEQLTTIYENPSADFPIKKRSLGNTEQPLAIQMLKMRAWDFVVLLPGDQKDHSYEKIRQILPANTKIIVFDGFSPILFSKELREKEVYELDSIYDSFSQKHQVYSLKVAKTFNQLIPVLLPDDLPFDSSFHLEDIGNKIVSCLIFKKVFCMNLLPKEFEILFGNDIRAHRIIEILNSNDFN